VGYLIFCVSGCAFHVAAGIGLAPSQQEKAVAILASGRARLRKWKRARGPSCRPTSPGAIDGHASYGCAAAGDPTGTVIDQIDQETTGVALAQNSCAANKTSEQRCGQQGDVGARGRRSYARAVI
jgi:hypothetical protein